MVNPPTHASILKRWTRRRERSKLARRLSELKSIPLGHTTILVWEYRSLIPAHWRDAIVEIARQDGFRGITRASLDQAAEIVQAKKSHPTKQPRSKPATQAKG